MLLQQHLRRQRHLRCRPHCSSPTGFLGRNAYHTVWKMTRFSSLSWRGGEKIPTLLLSGHALLPSGLEMPGCSPSKCLELGSNSWTWYQLNIGSVHSSLAVSFSPCHFYCSHSFPSWNEIDPTYSISPSCLHWLLNLWISQRRGT